MNVMPHWACTEWKNDMTRPATAQEAAISRLQLLLRVSRFSDCGHDSGGFSKGNTCGSDKEGGSSAGAESKPDKKAVAQAFIKDRINHYIEKSSQHKIVGKEYMKDMIVKDLYEKYPKLKEKYPNKLDMIIKSGLNHVIEEMHDKGEIFRDNEAVHRSKPDWWKPGPSPRHDLVNPYRDDEPLPKAYVDMTEREKRAQERKQYLKNAGTGVRGIHYGMAALLDRISRFDKG